MLKTMAKKVTNVKPIDEAARQRRSARKYVRAASEQIGTACPRPKHVDTNIGPVRVAQPWDAAACLVYSMGHGCEIANMIETYGFHRDGVRHLAEVTTEELLGAFFDASRRMSNALETDDIVGVYEFQTHVLMLSKLIGERTMDVVPSTHREPESKYDVS